MDLVATIGGTAANAYITLDDAELYFETRLHKTEWTAATDDNKEIALMWATRLLDASIEWKGSVVDTDQALQWPRGDVYDRNDTLISETVIPDDILNATCELALALIRSERTEDLEQDAQGLRRLTAGPIELEFKDLVQAKVIPDAVWAYIRPYGVIQSPKSAIATLLRS